MFYLPAFRLPPVGIYLLAVALSALLPFCCIQESWAAPLSDAPEYEANKSSIEFNEQGAQAVKSKDLTRAESLFKKALDADSKNLTAAFNLATMYLSNKKEEQAVTLLARYTAMYPEDPGLYARLGDAYFATKRPKEAMIAYETCLKLTPNYFSVPLKLSTVYLLMKRPLDAEKNLLLASEQDPKNVQVLANLSNVLLMNGKTEEAMRVAKKGLHIKATSELYLSLSTAYEVLKDYKSSAIALQRAIDLGDSRVELKEKVKALNSQL